MQKILSVLKIMTIHVANNVVYSCLIVIVYVHIVVNVMTVNVPFLMLQQEDDKIK